MNQSQAQEYLQCLICLELAKSAMECDSCNNIMCEECIQSLKKRECPSCRKVQFNYKPSVLARRMIGSMPCECPNKCGANSTIGNLEDHLKNCANRVYQCGGVEECKFEGKKQEFIEHIVKEHESRIVKMFDKQIQNDLQEEQKTSGAQKGDGNVNLAGLNFDRVGSMRNDQGRIARLGDSGKYYCGGVLGTNCMCCNGYCGPDNGCNCTSCMKLDIQTRVLQKGYLVNREGFSARPGTTGIYYCGRKALKGIAFCDGYCGPTNGPACPSCKILNQQSKDRYAALLT